jgi:hypothetical protein
MTALVAGSTPPGDEGPEIIDPQSAEFAQRLVEARGVMVGAEQVIRSGSARGRVAGVLEQVGCVQSDQGPKGSEPWDSQCDLRRSLGIFGADPVALMLRIEEALAKQQYRGTWYGPARTELRVADIRSGRVAASEVESASFANGNGLVINVQPGRAGQRQLFLTTSPRANYFDRSEGEDWELAVPRASVIKDPLVAVEILYSPFISRPA